MSNHRYLVQYAPRASAGYVVHDQKEKRDVFKHLQKSQVIAEAQRLNNFTPVDGCEQTYGKQTLR